MSPSIWKGESSRDSSSAEGGRQRSASFTGADDAGRVSPLGSGTLCRESIRVASSGGEGSDIVRGSSSGNHLREINRSKQGNQSVLAFDEAQLGQLTDAIRHHLACLRCFLGQIDGTTVLRLDRARHALGDVVHRMRAVQLGQ